MGNFVQSDLTAHNCTPADILLEMYLILGHTDLLCFFQKAL